MKNGRMQCKDVPDLPVLQFLANVPRWPEYPDVERPGGWWVDQDGKPGNDASVLIAMPPQTPAKLVLGKMRKLMRRGLVDGCGCGCRGDFELTQKGRDAIVAAPVEQTSPKQDPKGQP